MRFGEFITPLGGRHRVLRQQIAGEMTGVYVTTTEFPNVATLGEWQVRFGSNPEIREFVAGWDADPPATRAATMLVTRLA